VKQTEEHHEVRLLITGGGTGGHVSPALAVIQTIQEMQKTQDWEARFLYVGSASGVEAKLVGDAGIDFKAVACGKLRRSRNPFAMLSWQNLTDLFRIPVGIIQSLGLVLKFHPDAVLSTGGYVSVPAALAAAIAGIPILAHEQTAQIGLGNKIVLRFARRIALSFDLAQKDIPPMARHKSVVTGNPIRSVVLTGDKAKAIARYGFSDADNSLPTVYVTGGAQGAHVINEAVGQGLEELLTFCRIVHQCGKQPNQSVQDFDTLKEKAAVLPEDLRRRYAVTPFVGPEIGDAFALADVVVSRSGAGTVAEVAALGKAAVYVPLVPTGGDEQRKNARRFEDLGAAIVLDSSSLTGAKLVEALRPLLRDRNRVAAMGKAAHKMARPDAANALSIELLNLAGVMEGLGVVPFL